MKFGLLVTPENIVLSVQGPEVGLLHRLVRRTVKADLHHLNSDERSLAFAIADLRALADASGESLSIDSDRIVMSHRIAASVTGDSAALLGLPPLVDMTLKTDAEGIVGSSGFRLRYEWSRNGQRQLPSRTGAILQTANGPRRLPLWMLDAVEVADTHRSGKGDTSDWEALARFRKALDPGVAGSNEGEAGRISMTDFLSGLEVRLVDSFSISPTSETDFEVVPFSSDTVEAISGTTDATQISESMSEVAGVDLKKFQSMVKGRGAMPAYRLSPGKYVVVDRSAAPALEAMAEAQNSNPDERRNFIRNPLPKITAAMEQALRAEGKLDGLSPEAEQEAIETVVGPVFVETLEFSERVIGVVKYERPDLDDFKGNGTTWLPEEFSQRLNAELSKLSSAELQSLRERVAVAMDSDEQYVDFSDLSLPARPEMLELLEEKIASASPPPGDSDSEQNEEPTGPFVLETTVNYDNLKWLAALTPRAADLPDLLPQSIRTPLKSHQVESFAWQVKAWRAGLPGILNADEQGLGKTLQTISFLVWLKEAIAKPQALNRGPVLIVAPTSLLENWEQEVSRHVAEPGLGHLIRLYGSSIGGRKLTGARGKDTDNGEAKLDFGALHDALSEGRAHRFWLLTTYATLTNYQHSLARIPFSAVVFDEIQALKNPISLRAVAARSINANFRIGLTGTPIENSTVDLWAIMDQLAPGSLESLKDFRQRYMKPEEGNMAELYSRVFAERAEIPPLAIRRLKETVATELPSKSRRIHPRLMPNIQALAYDDARMKLASGRPGAQLKMLHHIRSVSVHPMLDSRTGDEEFVVSSGRLAATMDILRQIKMRGERALVFIEHRQMQYRFIELIRSELGLARVDLINGDTPIPQRQAIVNRFQRHLSDDQGFDVLVLGPKAAGTGLTLTAATHVIHLSRWWNPAVEEQCNDRVHRIGQARPVTVHVPMAIHEGYREQSFDCLLQSLMMRKRRLASSALWPMGDVDDDIAELQRGMTGDKMAVDGDPLTSAMSAMFNRDELDMPNKAADGSFAFN